RVGWGGRIRTFEYGIQSPAPYRLATPQSCPAAISCRTHSTDVEEADFRSGLNHVAQTVSVYDRVFPRQVRRQHWWVGFSRTLPHPRRTRQSRVTSPIKRACDDDAAS